MLGIPIELLEYAAKLNGGQNWFGSVGLTSVPGNRANLFDAVISPVDGNTVFAMGLELETGGRHIYGSTNAGVPTVPWSITGRTACISPTGRS